MAGDRGFSDASLTSIAQGWGVPMVARSTLCHAPRRTDPLTAPLIMRRNLLLVLATCVLTPLAWAQGGPPPNPNPNLDLNPNPNVTPTPNPLETFLRLSSLVGQPVNALAATWPATLQPGVREARLQLTGADRLLVTLDASRPGGVARVDGVTLIERLPDTLALQRRVAAVQDALVARIGAADRCAGAPGAPAFLFTPHEATRLWTRGLQGAPTRLTWRVGGVAGEYVVHLQVGAFADAGADDAYACNARMP
jgi:hypothetical protein